MDNSRFQVRATEKELKELDEAIQLLGFKDRADWYREMKRKTLQKASTVKLKRMDSISK